MKLLLLCCAVVPLVACGDEGRSTSATVGAVGTVAVTACAVGSFDAGQTVIVHDDDLVGGFGSFGTRTPSGLQAGTVRISVEADAENAGPVSVAITLDGARVGSIDGVASGSTCAIDVDLVAGHYDVTDGQQKAGFDVIAASPAP